MEIVELLGETPLILIMHRYATINYISYTLLFAASGALGLSVRSKYQAPLYQAP